MQEGGVNSQFNDNGLGGMPGGGMPGGGMPGMGGMGQGYNSQVWVLLCKTHQDRLGCKIAV